VKLGGLRVLGDREVKMTESGERITAANECKTKFADEPWTGGFAV